MAACGLDFGTSNSALGVLRDGAPVLAPVEGESALIPSAIFFDFETHGRVLFGRQAIETYIDQHDGRLMRALKTILASPLIDETTALGRRRIALRDVVGIFIGELKKRAESFLGEEIDTVVHGRPVRFVDGDDEADRRAEAVLEDIARRAGFREVTFEYEPIAAAYHYEETVEREEIVLVADIGGGTSDFSVIRIGPERSRRPDRRADILANGGTRIGGTDFDSLLSLDAVMPLLGLGTRLVEKDLPMPKAVYFDLATWATINFLYTYRTEREVRELAAGAREPDKVARLLKAIRRRLGHRIAFAVEGAKIALSEEEDRDDRPRLSGGGTLGESDASGLRGGDPGEDRPADAGRESVRFGCRARARGDPDDLLHRRIEPGAGRAQGDLRRSAGGESCDRLGLPVRRLWADARGGAGGMGRALNLARLNPSEAAVT